MNKSEQQEKIEQLASHKEEEGTRCKKVEEEKKSLQNENKELSVESKQLKEELERAKKELTNQAAPDTNIQQKNKRVKD